MSGKTDGKAVEGYYFNTLDPDNCLRSTDKLSDLRAISLWHIPVDLTPSRPQAGF